MFPGVYLNKPIGCFIHKLLSLGLRYPYVWIARECGRFLIYFFWLIIEYRSLQLSWPGSKARRSKVSVASSPEFVHLDDGLYHSALSNSCGGTTLGSQKLMAELLAAPAAWQGHVCWSISAGVKDFPAPAQKAVLLSDLCLEWHWYGEASWLLRGKETKWALPKSRLLWQGLLHLIYSDRLSARLLPLGYSFSGTAEALSVSYFTSCPLHHSKGWRWALSTNAAWEEHPSILSGFMCLDNKCTWVPRVIFPTHGREEESRCLRVT